jgi:hypothetical protein
MGFINRVSGFDKLEQVNKAFSIEMVALTPGKVAWLTIIQNTNDKGFSMARRSRAYFLTPGLTTPMRNSKTLGRKWATIFITQKLSQTNLQLVDAPEVDID